MMRNYLAKRLTIMLMSFIGVTILVFSLVRLIPGTVVDIMLGTEALTNYETIESLRRYFGLDQPVWVQYYEWVSRLLTGDLGRSWRSGLPVLEFVSTRLTVTVELAILAVVVAMAIGLPVGIFSALKRNTFLDNLARLFALGGLSIPVFWQGTMFIVILSAAFNWAPSINWVPPQQDLGANLSSMLLPSFCLGTASAAVVMRMTRSCMLEVLSQDYVRTAHAKGLSYRVVLTGHALKNAMIPIVTVAGLQMGYLLGGTVVVEEVFSLPGLGRLLLWAIYQRDYPTVQGVVLFIAGMFMLLNLLVDLLYGLLDPRIRYG